jgi:flagellar basal-body rod protein FlgB
MEPIIQLLTTGLDGAYFRQKALANNIANINTPGYKRREVDFLSALNLLRSGLSLKRTNPDHFKGSDGVRAFKGVLVSNSSYRNDQNNVDIDVEMAELAKNNLYYNTLVQQINERFKNLQDTISKGGNN